MNDHRQMEVHYINTGFPYTVPESFMDFFEGLTYAQADFFLGGAWTEQEQENAYWTMYTSAYKYSLPDSSTYSYFNHSEPYEASDHLPRMDGDVGNWENLSVMKSEEPSPSAIAIQEEDGSSATHAAPEECIRSQPNASSSQDSQVTWQDNIDPDNMTYEELLDLGEAVGTQNRGLSQDRISSLPVSKYKWSFILRKKERRERCVICQMFYKRGDRQMTLPCKHVYHASCVSRWLGINKACPVCFKEVFGDEARH